MKYLSLFIVLLFIGVLPVMGQDATPESTVDPMPVEIVATSAPVEGSGNDTVINVGTPAETETPPVTPAEPMPWWATAGLEIGKLVALYLVVVRGARELVKAFLADPRRVAAAENAANLVKSITPDVLEEAARIGAQKAYAETQELVNDLRRALIAVTDGVPESSKVTPPSNASVSSTGGAFDSTAPRMPGN
jgi:hypothetical protein